MENKLLGGDSVERRAIYGSVYIQEKRSYASSMHYTEKIMSASCACKDVGGLTRTRKVKIEVKR